MNQTVTLLVLLSADPTPEEQRALATFQARERVVLTPPVAGVPTPRQVYTDDVARRIEAALDEAQTLASSLDEERALALLVDVERELLLHPELPQAPWLMAECQQSAAEIRRKQADGGSEAERLVLSARALEGPRAPRFGEATQAASIPSGEPPVDSVLLTVRDLSPRDVLVLDGRAVTSRNHVAPGRHHARVLRDASVAWAGWFEVPNAPRVDRLLGVPERTACSSTDLAAVTAGPRAPSAPAGVQCARWVAVRRGHAGLEVSWCEGARCTAFGPLLREQMATRTKPTIAPWAAATLVGIATLGAASILVASGAFERDRPAPVDVTVYRGPR